MSAHDILLRTAGRTGWNTESMLAVICAYVDHQDADDAFADHVDHAAKVEINHLDGTSDLFADANTAASSGAATKRPEMESVSGEEQGPPAAAGCCHPHRPRSSLELLRSGPPFDPAP